MSDDFIYIKNLEYVYVSQAYDCVYNFLSKKERIKQILKKNRLKISKKYSLSSF